MACLLNQLASQNCEGDDHADNTWSGDLIKNHDAVRPLRQVRSHLSKEYVARPVSALFTLEIWNHRSQATLSLLKSNFKVSPLIRMQRGSGYAQMHEVLDRHRPRAKGRMIFRRSMETIRYPLLWRAVMVAL